MGIDPSQAPLAEPRSFSRRQNIALAAAIMLVVGLALFQRATLIDHLPAIVNGLSALAGFGAGLWLSLRLEKMPSKQSAWSRTLALLAIPVFGIFIGNFLARTIIVTGAFSGIDAPGVEVEADIVRTRLSRWGVHFAKFSTGTGSRELESKVSSELFARLDPIRSPGRDCLSLTVETGRRGIRRTFLPNLFDTPVGIERYRKCKSGEPRSAE